MSCVLLLGLLLLYDHNLALASYGGIMGGDSFDSSSSFDSISSFDSSTYDVSYETQTAISDSRSSPGLMQAPHHE